MRNNQPVNDQHYVLGDQQFLISQTDTDGNIIYANPAFIDVSGFERHELIGAPHNLVRHPDMPKVAFANLWQTLRDGETWVGMVKNRRKDGGYYWVRATVMPMIEEGRLKGYASVRVKADDAAIAHADHVYRQINSGQGGRWTLVQGVITPAGPRGWPSRFKRMTNARRAGWAGMTCALSSTALLGLLLADYEIFSTQQSLPVTMSVLTLGAAFLSSVSGVASALLARRVQRSLDQALLCCRQIASGDLEMSHHSQDQLMIALDTMRKCVLCVVRDVKRSAGVMAPASNELASGNQDLSRRTEEQAASLEQTASSMEELTATVGHNAEHAGNASQLAHQASSVAERGHTEMDDVVARMQSIAQASTRISDIVGVIDGIAFQTNILALNASVEAARAGEQGKGFAVVANEVRSLAGRSAQAAREIRELIDQSSVEVSAGGELVTRAQSTMTDIVSGVHRVSSLMEEISSASREQKNGIEQIGQAINRMDEMTQQNAAMVEQSSAASESMRQNADHLNEIVSLFRIKESSRTPIIASHRTAPATGCEKQSGGLESKRRAPVSIESGQTGASAVRMSATRQRDESISDKADEDWTTF
ncbi:methyl-accepting chemotaxis sensory transducer with Pas/Pac sensor [Kushneria avicenniae]|uniref:Methyl-accepting chemotaxis sensory transducer with Pas/Pac sensor n=1 Tax=Kushneria avicenniae TaxID=402385 RepID=A0A1I1FD96_9GAMM|nr:PAS domain-containing methyl-accepting chemotaxis protein [Kushneria avicenniae]SFB95113.1 methyl-accepting chemotaxis sensory transducer with Pas/Pac sensor [Kushneria avicenniae]